MGLLDRFFRTARAQLNSLVSGAEDPEKVLQQTVTDMQNDLIQLRQAVAQAIATQKRTERQCDQARSTAEEWYRRAELALQKGDETAAREALTRRQAYAGQANAMDQQMQEQTRVVTELKQNMRSLEAKIAETRTKKDMYIARARSAQASQRINEMIGQVGTQGAMGAFEQMEERILELEAQSEAVAELAAGDPLEAKFAELEGQPSSIDSQLAELKSQILTGDQSQPEELPPA
ncbi:PspA/IM30 family protein [Romeria aff. gracilis LEGE 07310]|uniref:PspA/IM30 family protein n=1 Tax=Vasconcelosia minhoensis LEGE 07310 TaxID=915328 RepID=A0A8J7AFR2_9CYAN|nr:PspA/IM30 family protein [Romeria gracilis]MBE9076678.1 PspA/IM30 family protein [Romeria aff. gracilis LEGE 07310]